MTRRRGSFADDRRPLAAWGRSFSLRMLPSLTGDALLNDCGEDGWTPRKVLRRMIWHERDHTRQIAAPMAACSP